MSEDPSATSGAADADREDPEPDREDSEPGSEERNADRGGRNARSEDPEPGNDDDQPRDPPSTEGAEPRESGADGSESDPAADASAGPEDESPADADSAGDTGSAGNTDAAEDERPADDVPPDVRKYERFTKMNGAQYDRVNEFLRDRTYVTAREWAIARLCADFRTETGVEMTKIGENLPELVPFMTDTYTPQAVNQARHSFEEKVTKAGATFLYGAMCGFFTAEDLDEMMYEVTEIAKFLMEVEGVDLAVEDELEAEERISSVMREVRESSQQLRGQEVTCPECGHVHEADPEE